MKARRKPPPHADGREFFAILEKGMADISVTDFRHVPHNVMRRIREWAEKELAQ